LLSDFSNERTSRKADCSNLTTDADERQQQHASWWTGERCEINC
jgi:hypothetical protein